jgi:hypothetical protein
MKRIKILFVLLLIASFTVCAQKDVEPLLFRAMNDELKRSMDSLSLPGMQKPFYLAYTVKRSKGYDIKSSYGGIVSATEGDIYCKNNFRVDLYVGNYHRCNIMASLTGMKGYFTDQLGELPDDLDYSETRRLLWQATDKMYKKAATDYDKKMSSLKQMNLSPETEAVDDYAKISPVEKKVAHRIEFNPNRRAYWEKTLNAVSSVFAEYPDIIDCDARISVHSADIYFLSNEGSRVINAQDFSSLFIRATARTEEGEEISSGIGYQELDEARFPSQDSLISAAKNAVQKIYELKNAPKVNETYYGPVLFDNCLSLIRLFLEYRTGLTAYKAYQTDNEGKSLENLMNRRILPSNINIISEPGLKEFNGKQLWGAYEVDAEGVVPPDTLFLVEKGMLRNVLNGRFATLKTPFSNGHNITTAESSGAKMDLGPGVLHMYVTDGGETKAQLKEKLIRLAIEEGLDYAYIVRDGFYKVNVNDGSEQRVRGLTTQTITVQMLKRMAGISSDQIVANGSYLYVPYSMIYPSSILLEDIEVSKDGIRYNQKAPLVTSPLFDKNATDKMQKRKSKQEK